MWKVASNALPMRGMFTDATDPSLAVWAPCPLCSEGTETPLHLFIQCVIAQVLWRQSIRPLDVTRLPLQNMKDLVEYFILNDNRRFSIRNDHRVVALNAAIVLDTIWQARNEVIHNSGSIHLHSLINSVKAKVYDHLMAWNKIESAKPNRWKPPDMGWL